MYIYLLSKQSSLWKDNTDLILLYILSSDIDKVDSAIPAMMFPTVFHLICQRLQHKAELELILLIIPFK